MKALKRSFLFSKTLVSFQNLRKYSAKAWHVVEHNGIEGLQCLDNVAQPVLKHPCDVLIKVRAASVNPLDVLMTEGYGREVFGKLQQLDSSCSTPLVTGRDFAGIVEAKGAAVDGLQVRQEVFGCINPPFNGSHAHYAVASASNVKLKPDNRTFEEAASLPYAGLTAWSALRVTGELCENSYGKKVLVLGASGGVGTIAVQLLKLWGATVIASCGTDAIPLVKSLGADEVLDYRLPDFQYNLQQLADYDVILDSSGSVDTGKVDLLKSWSNAKYVTLSPPAVENFDEYGLFGGAIRSTLDILASNVSALSKGRTIRWAFFMPNATALQKMKEYLENNKIKPVIDSVFKFDDLPQAFEKMKSGHPRGKIIVSMS